MNFCSNCGSDKIRLEIPEGDNRLRFVCKSCHTIHYQNPNMVVGCIPVFEDQILLCRRAIEPRSGFWNLPAGYLENGETLEEGALREAREEAGIELELLRLHSIYNIPRINQVYFFFLTAMKTPEFRIGPETLEAQFFHQSEIPYHDMAFPSSSFALKKYFHDRAEGFSTVHLGGWEHT
ncbi:NUDIX hydrolase [Pontibacter sp. G13]|uniref:NUDIX hydrolase n=1 Tax=Pontibacter sp. G13 TaxID=3074898 RepID=UPI002889B760|nr:NUDIX hydrolase [Pontibacter sp. G13]WNJ16391.1 NUDIX hydrolase [Pontibacter sp. G13]